MPKKNNIIKYKVYQEPFSFGYDRCKSWYPELEESLREKLAIFNDSKHMKNTGQWDSLMRELFCVVAKWKRVIDYRYDRKNNLSLLREHRQTIINIRDGLDTLPSNAMEFLWESFVDDELDPYEAKELKEGITKKLIKDCDIWLSYVGTKKEGLLAGQRKLVGGIVCLLQMYTLLQPSYSVKSHYVTFCYKVFICAFGAKFSHDDVRNRLRDRLGSPKKGTTKPQ